MLQHFFTFLYTYLLIYYLRDCVENFKIFSWSSSKQSVNKKKNRCTISGQSLKFHWNFQALPSPKFKVTQMMKTDSVISTPLPYKPLPFSTLLEMLPTTLIIFKQFFFRCYRDYIPLPWSFFCLQLTVIFWFVIFFYCFVLCGFIVEFNVSKQKIYQKVQYI